jgi:hypothetical protein
MVTCGCNGNTAGHHRLDGMLAEVALNAFSMRLIPRALQDLRHDQIADDQRFPSREFEQPRYGWGPLGAQRSDSDRAVHHD